MTLRVPVSPGELIDKLTILEIKLERMSDPAKKANVAKEFDVLSEELAKSVRQSSELTQLHSALKQVNETLWVVEDDIRDCERAQDFGPKFIELARSVYRINDRRAEIKKEINLLLNSDLIEEKSYAAY
jgi:hypothetical protein